MSEDKLTAREARIGLKFGYGLLVVALALLGSALPVMSRFGKIEAKQEAYDRHITDHGHPSQNYRDNMNERNDEIKRRLDNLEKFHKRAYSP